MKLFNISILVLLIVVVCFQTCNFINGRIDIKDKSSVDTVYVKSHDTWHNVPFKVEVPKPYKVEVPGTPGTTITIPATIDSLAIAVDYFTKRHYQDSLKNDSIEIKLKYTVWKNQPMDMSIMYRWIAKTMVIEHTNVVERQLAYAGLDVTGNGSYLGVCPSIYLDTRQGMFGAGYDPINKIYKVGVYRKLKLWKKRINPK